MLNQKNNSINVEVRRIGGGFGGKETQSFIFAAICTLLSKKTNRLIATRQEIDSLIDYLVSNFNIFEKVDIWRYGQIKNYFQEDILDDNYLNFNKIGNKLVYDYFTNDFRKKEANKNLINLQSNLREKQQNLIT